MKLSTSSLICPPKKTRSILAALNISAKIARLFSLVVLLLMGTATLYIHYLLFALIFIQPLMATQTVIDDFAHFCDHTVIIAKLTDSTMLSFAYVCAVKFRYGTRDTRPIISLIELYAKTSPLSIHFTRITDINRDHIHYALLILCEIYFTILGTRLGTKF